MFLRVVPDFVNEAREGDARHRDSLFDLVEVGGRWGLAGRDGLQVLGAGRGGGGEVFFQPDGFHADFGDDGVPVEVATLPGLFCFER